MAEKPDFWSFTLAFREELFAAMSGGASVPFTIAAVYVDNKYAQALLALCALTCAWFAAFRLWRPERQKVRDYEKRLMPKISVFLDPVCNGVRVVETSKSDDPLSRGSDSKWIQFLVRSVTDAPLVGCEARLLTAERLKSKEGTESILDEPMFCTWSNVDQMQSTRMTIPVGVNQPANMLSIFEGQSNLKPETAPYMKPRFLREIQKPGKYRLNVVVSAQDAPVETASFLLEWGGSYNNIKISKE
jgi:hypothetical protein